MSTERNDQRSRPNMLAKNQSAKNVTDVGVANRPQACDYDGDFKVIVAIDFGMIYNV